MKVLNSLKFRSKLILLLLFPLGGMFFFSTLGILEKNNLLEESYRIQKLSEFAITGSALVHELQKERGATSGFLGSEGRKFATELPEQRAKTDAGIQDLNNFLDGFDDEAYSNELHSILVQILKGGEKIDSIRQSVDSLRISAENAISYYSEYIKLFLDVSHMLSGLTSDGKFAIKLVAYNSLMMSKENAGIERAVLSNTFGRGSFAAGMFNKFQELTANQKTYQEEFRKLSTVSEMAYFKSKMQGSVIDQVEDYRKAAREGNERIKYIAELYTLVGYGGIVHNFKNYVIRGTDTYAVRIRTKYNEVDLLIGRILEMDSLSENDRKDLGVIRETFYNYNTAVDKVQKMKEAGNSVTIIDSSVKINDGPAIEALIRLSQGGDMGVDPEKWFAAATDRINLMKDIEDRFALDLTMEVVASQRKAQNGLLIFALVSGAMLIITILLAYFIISDLLKLLGGEPVRIVAITEQVAIGDLEIDTSSNGKKSTGIFLSVRKMVEVLKYKAEILESIAGGDLTVNIKKASDVDGLGKSLVIMKESLNTLLSGVNESVIQVTSGVDQISQVSQALAQGASEQAATLEEISAASLEIKSQATLNADNSQKAYDLARQSNQDADSGNIKMSELLSAMNSIRGSSDEINKIVKLIDDIAFQINLLALNANVEAARAGKYGKGFAVVADEVRNLAVRSADAVKQTTEMVEDSVRNIEIGSKITEETAEILNRILTGSSTVADFLRKISEGSTEQEKGITEIVKGLDQIDQVTQANAAQSEETASASEEISAQGQELRNMIAAFKLEKSFSNIPELKEGHNPEYIRLNKPVLKALPGGNEGSQF